MRRRQVGYGLAGVALCLGGVLAACGGGGDGDGYVAVGAAGAGPEEGPADAVAPSGKVELFPLDGTTPPAGAPSAGGPSGGGTSGDTGTGAGAGTGTGTGAGTAPGAGSSAAPGHTEPPSRPSTGPGGTPAPTAPGTDSPGTPSPGTTPPATPPGPAVLSIVDLVRDTTDTRWCEKVTLEFRNTGGSPVPSGSVTFETHIIGALGIDWATVESAQPLPAPISAGATKTRTYTVCVDSWRVPLGMHIETQDARAEY
ncbi:hypothetical protein [Streptomyces sp. NPDC059909]|uniref:hypothetical protein n=1 Tax=Streptomyces sp. NPDC059909 TaxID=3346998 RepID=UPI003647192F